MKQQSSSEDEQSPDEDEKKTAPTLDVATKDTQSPSEQKPAISPCSSYDFLLPTTPTFITPSPNGSRFNSRVSMGFPNRRRADSISLGEVSEPIDQWISQTMQKIETALGGLTDITEDVERDEDSDDKQFNDSLSKVMKHQNETKKIVHEHSMSELPKRLNNTKKSAVQPQKNRKEGTVKKKPHHRHAASELRPRHYNPGESKIKPYHKRDNESEVPSLLHHTQVELIENREQEKQISPKSHKSREKGKSKHHKESDKRQPRQHKDGSRTHRWKKDERRKKSNMSPRKLTSPKKHHHNKSDMRAISERKRQADDRKTESEVIRELLQKIKEVQSNIHEFDIEIDKEERSLADLGGGENLKKQIETLRNKLEWEPTSSEIETAKEKNRGLTRERDEHIALTGDLLEENKELREKIRRRNEQLTMLSSIVQNHASESA